MKASILIAIISTLTLNACKYEDPQPLPSGTPVPSPVSSPLPTLEPRPTLIPKPSPAPSLSPAPQPTPFPTPTTTPESQPIPSYSLLWEAKRPESKAWTAHVYHVIQDEVANIYWPGSSDITDFCPNYNSLDNRERTQFWGLLISAISKFESGFDPTSRMKEGTMGKDPITGEDVYSEGLLQLSYQDTQWAHYCEFDWEKDKELPRNDSRKTILDPIKNLSCGMKILANQVKKRGVIAAPSKYAYWAVLIPGRQTLPQIIAITKKAPGCDTGY